MNSQHWPCRNNGTHIEDRENFVKVHPPAGDCLAIVSCVQESPSDCILLILLGDFVSDICHSAVVGSIVLSMNHPNRLPLI